jgi:hypothetical protein
MARKIELRTGCLLANGADGAPVVFAWGEMMQNVLRRAPQGGINLNEILRSIAEQLNTMTTVETVDAAADR